MGPKPPGKPSPSTSGRGHGWRDDLRPWRIDYVRDDPFMLLLSVVAIPFVVVLMLLISPLWLAGKGLQWLTRPRGVPKRRRKRVPPSIRAFDYTKRPK